MNIGLISVIVALVVLLLNMRFLPRRINSFIFLYNKSLSDLAVAENKGEINTIKHKEAADKINKYYKEFDKWYDMLKMVERVELLKLFLPPLLMFEILHITLQEFGWSLLYEWIFPGLNKLYVVIVIVFMLLYFILTLSISVTITDKKILGLESEIFSVMAEYLYGFK